MKISLNWLQDFIEITEKDNDKIKAMITANTAEIETMETVGDYLGNIVVGEIKEFHKHPDAEKLNVAQVEVGEEKPRQIIFGQMVTMNVGDHVPVALAPTKLPSGMMIERKKMRGITSEGMLCLEQELGLKEKGISILYFPNTKPGTTLAKALGLDDTVIDIDNHAINNRWDLFSQRGFAREMVANQFAKWKKWNEFKIPKNNTPPPINYVLQDDETGSRYTAVYITNVNVKPSPEWMQRRLTAAGIRPISNLVDITNYVMREMGTPLHAFDVDQVKGKTWTQRLSKKGEKVVTLDQQEHELMENVVVFEDGHEIFDLCGIMGGYQSGINEKTNKIWLHCPVYSKTLVRRASRALGHISDASVIFEKGVDPEAVLAGLSRAVQLILESCPEAHVASQVVDVYNKKGKNSAIQLRESQLEKLIGTKIPSKNVERILKDLGFTFTKAKGSYKVTPPSWRNDVKLEADLIEEVARIHGYDNIPFTTPIADLTPVPINPRRALEKEIKDKLAALGFDEIYTFAFLGPELLKKCGLGQNDTTIEIANPISSDISLMRQSLLPRTLETMEQTWRHEEKFRLFELSKTYFKKNNDVDERTALILAGCGEDFRTLQGVVEALGLTVEHATGKTETPAHHPGRRAALTARGQKVGWLYEAHPLVLKALDIKARVTIAEIDLETVHALKIDRRQKFHDLPRFPSIKLDVSIAFPKHELAARYLDSIAKTDKTLIENIELIDEYEGDQIAADQRGLTYSITYRAKDRTLTEEEVNKIHERVLQNLKNSGAAIRM